MICSDKCTTKLLISIVKTHSIARILILLINKFSGICEGESWFGTLNTLRWRHNGRDNDPNHQPHGCLLKRLFRPRSRKTSKLRVTGLCVGNSPGTGEFPAQMASNAENVSIWWRHHENVISLTVCLDCMRWRLSKEKPLILPMTKKTCCSLPTECVSVIGVAIYFYCDGCGFIDTLVLVAYCPYWLLLGQGIDGWIGFDMMVVITYPRPAKKCIDDACV